MFMIEDYTLKLTSSMEKQLGAPALRLQATSTSCTIYTRNVARSASFSETLPILLYKTFWGSSVHHGCQSRTRTASCGRSGK